MKKIFFCLFLISQISFSQCWIKVEIGDNHTLAIKSDGTLWAWGWNNQKQLGDGTVTDKHTPTQIGTDNNWTDIAAGQNISFGIKSD
jgi:alpha-tubulin suppressor-like RCC1 family protein